MPDQFRTAGGWFGWMALEVADPVVLFETDQAAVNRSPGARGRAEDGEALRSHLRQVRTPSVGRRTAGIGEVSGRPEVVEGPERFRVVVILREAGVPPHFLRYFRIHRLARELVAAKDLLGLLFRERLRPRARNEQQREENGERAAPSNRRGKKPERVAPQPPAHWWPIFGPPPAHSYPAPP